MAQVSPPTTAAKDAHNPCPRDPLWSRAGEVLHADLRDRIFGVPGSWSLRQSVEGTDTFLWLDPRPTPDTLPSFYRSYYTHVADTHGQRVLLEWVYRRGLSWLPYMRERERLERMYLDAGNGRRLLELGCGDGSRLDQLRTLGWQVQGQEVDAAAAANASKRFGLEVSIGDVTALPFPDANFDAVVMNHVIEHLLDPAAVLARCRQLLRAGGTLVVTTPNIDSYGHATFGRNWVSLDPPRHLQLFSLGALRTLVEEAGFPQVEGWTTSARAEAVGRGSTGVRAGVSPWNPRKTLARHASALLFQWRSLWRHRADPMSGEELVVRATS